MSKHTPGEWRHEPYEGSHESAIIGGGYQIATVGYDGFEHANARLIAAAPDLLAACEAAVALYGQQGGPWNVPSEPGSWLAQARAAIAKAKA